MKMTDRIIRFSIHLGVHLLMIISVLALAYVAMQQVGFVPSASKIYQMNNVQDYAVGGIQGENVVIQTFRATQPVETIGIKMATYGRKNPGVLNLRVFDYESGETYSWQSVQANTILDNNFNVFKLNQVLPARRALYAFELSGETPQVFESVGVWSSYDNTYDEGQLHLSDFETDGDLLFYLASDQNSGLTRNTLTAIGLTALLFLVLAAYLYIQVKAGKRSTL